MELQPKMSTLFADIVVVGRLTSLVGATPLASGGPTSRMTEFCPAERPLSRTTALAGPRGLASLICPTNTTREFGSDNAPPCFVGTSELPRGSRYLQRQQFQIFSGQPLCCLVVKGFIRSCNLNCPSGAIPPTVVGSRPHFGY